MLASDLRRLAAPFPPADVEWKPGATTRDKSKGLAMCYISSRAVQNRLDDVCGPADWRNEFRPGPEGGVLCGISVYVERADGTAEWITKWDGSESTDIEAVKGGLSGSMKRAAVQWGIGRYLYDLPAQWVRLDDRGRFAETPRIPREHLPQSDGDARPAPRAPQQRSQQRPQTGGRTQTGSRPQTGQQRPTERSQSNGRPTPGGGSQRPSGRHPSSQRSPGQRPGPQQRPAPGGDGARRDLDPRF